MYRQFLLYYFSFFLTLAFVTRAAWQGVAKTRSLEVTCAVSLEGIPCALPPGVHLHQQV